MEERELKDEEEAPPTEDDPFYNPMKDIGFTDMEEHVEETREFTEEERTEEVLRELDNILQEINTDL